MTESCGVNYLGDDEHTKDVYAYFGLAYSSASVFESALINAMLYLDYLAQVKRQFKGAASFSRPAFEAGFDAFMAKQQAMTLGALVKRAQSFAETDAALTALIFKATSRRIKTIGANGSANKDASHLSSPLVSMHGIARAYALDKIRLGVALKTRAA